MESLQNRRGRGDTSGGIHSPRGVKGQASFFDAIMFMLLVIFSITLVFAALNNYTVAQDKVLRSAYLSNYLQSVAKMLYYVDVSSLQNVKSYCNDPEVSTGSGYYCRFIQGGTDKYGMNCGDLKKYKGFVTVADLLKRDADPSDDSNPRFNLDDKFGTSEQMGLTALRCAMKEVIKPFTFSGYRYITEIADASVGGAEPELVVYPANEKFASDFVFAQRYQQLDDDKKKKLDCEKISKEPSIQSDQLLVIRTPFKILISSDDTHDSFSAKNYVLRTCLWPSSDLTS